MIHPDPHLFFYFRSFQLQFHIINQRDSNLDHRVEGEHADHLTTTTAHQLSRFWYRFEVLNKVLRFAKL